MDLKIDICPSEIIVLLLKLSQLHLKTNSSTRLLDSFNMMSMYTHTQTHTHIYTYMYSWLPCFLAWQYAPGSFCAPCHLLLRSRDLQLSYLGNHTLDIILWMLGLLITTRIAFVLNRNQGNRFLLLKTTYFFIDSSNFKLGFHFFYYPWPIMLTIWLSHHMNKKYSIALSCNAYLKTSG
jgi:hypothetical protein